MDTPTAFLSRPLPNRFPIHWNNGPACLRLKQVEITGRLQQEATAGRRVGGDAFGE